MNANEIEVLMENSTVYVSMVRHLAEGRLGEILGVDQINDDGTNGWYTRRALRLGWRAVNRMLAAGLSCEQIDAITCAYDTLDDARARHQALRDRGAAGRGYRDELNSWHSTKEEILSAVRLDA